MNIRATGTTKLLFCPDCQVGTPHRQYRGAGGDEWVEYWLCLACGSRYVGEARQEPVELTQQRA